MSDILVDIPDEDLPELSKLYVKHVELAPFICSLIDLGIRWKKSKYANFITFMSPNNSWRKDGTIVVLHSYNSYDLIVFSLEESCENLYQGLLKTKRIDYIGARHKEILFFSVFHKHIPTIKKVVDDLGLEIATNTFCCMVAIPPEEAKQFELNTSLEIYLKKLSPHDAIQVNAIWPHRYPNSEKYLSALIEMNGGVGAFLKSNDELVAWSLVHCMGHLGMIQTEEPYKKRGYGTLVTKALSKELAEGGHWPFGTVISTNEPSLKMFEKLGFRKLGLCTYISLKPIH